MGWLHCNFNNDQTLVPFCFLVIVTFEGLHGFIETLPMVLYWSLSRPYVVLDLVLTDDSNAHLRVEEYLMDVHGFNISYHLVPQDSELQTVPCSVEKCSYLGHCLASADFRWDWSFQWRGQQMNLFKNRSVCVCFFFFVFFFFFFFLGGGGGGFCTQESPKKRLKFMTRMLFRGVLFGKLFLTIYCFEL